MKNIVLVFSLLMSIGLYAEEGQHSVGLQAGQVGLSGNVGDAYGSAIGYGAFFNYAGSDFLELQLNYLTSKHTKNNLNLTKNSLGVAAVYIIDQADAFVPFVKGGAEFDSHEQDIISGVSRSTSAFGLLAGVGTQFIIGPNLMAGLDFTYHGMFDAKTTVAGAEVTTINSYYTVMLQFGYRFSGK